MAIHTPSLFTDSDVLTFRETPASDYRIPYTFVESLNEGTLFDRSARTFEEAARTQRLYDVIVGEDQRIIGAGMLQDSFKEADGHHREEELGALMVHPAARGIGIVGLMVKLWSTATPSCAAATRRRTTSLTSSTATAARSMRFWPRDFRTSARSSFTPANSMAISST
jgi:hypothetical protein